MQYSSLLIVIEGCDSSGKTTQSKLLKEYILSKYPKTNVVLLDFPQYEGNGIFGPIVGRFLKGEFGDPVTADPFETAILYAGDRLAAREKLNTPNTIILLNRYVPSNVVYGRAKLRILGRADECDAYSSFVENLEYDHLKLPRPDVVIVLNVSEEDAQKNIASRAPHESRSYLGCNETDEYERSDSLQRFVRQEYLRAAGCHVISSLQKTVPEVQQCVQKCVQTALEKFLRSAE